MKTLRPVLLLLLLARCGGETPTSDAGQDASSDVDAGPHDAGSDAGECIAVSVESWRLALADDVSIRYRARITPSLGTEPWDLYLEFIRYDTSYVGEFPLGEGPDANYGSCAHCVVAWYGTNLSHAFLARAGTLTLREDPFTQHLDATLAGVILEEVMIGGETLSSTPIPGGRCLALADTSVTGTFPPAGWRCPTEQYDDNTTCHCSCGAPDPDCGWQCTLPPEPGCDPTPLPIAGCSEGDLCTWDGMCAASCQFGERVGCASGVCAFSSDGDRCFDAADPLVDPAALGAECEPFAGYCAVDAEGFAMGLCDSDSNWLCRPVCEGDADCTEPETCYTLFFDPATETGQGFCKTPPPPCRPTGEACTEHLDCCTVLCEGGGGGTAGTCG